MKANFYIDGYNFYAGMCEAGLHGNIWIDVQKLCELLKLKSEFVNQIKYFTSLPTFNKAKRERHQVYLNAISAYCPLVTIIKGQFSEEDARETCPGCGKLVVAECIPCNWKRSRKRFKEKMTDVNIAVQMVSDAINKEFDVAYLITGDTDLVPAVEAVKALIPAPKLVVFFPPARMTGGFFNIADRGIQISPPQIRAVQLPDPVPSGNGPIQKPSTWI